MDVMNLILKNVAAFIVGRVIWEDFIPPAYKWKLTFFIKLTVLRASVCKRRLFSLFSKATTPRCKKTMTRVRVLRDDSDEAPADAAPSATDTPDSQINKR